ncbi:MerR family transcriptional regulator [Streptomyces coffeae]|uniref:MerR family transcriptional regulator n=1 Tax=Streptomyces coffeae TaxID=621382 RepID=A0ABS1NRD9_9ACTN|nr:GyrI-like domain-containing protein [Streptomyces coffeae]MBL1102509.1 MerR family transcriptional regulator [Streptomyces coffeae]
MRNDLLTIGRFARLCRLSVKQLRHYDELGLLAAVHVDVGTGYRYYAPDQARDALTIGLLREMDLPLTVIAEILTARPPTRARILRAERERLAERIRRDRTRMDMLERLAEGGLPGYEVTMGGEPPLELAVTRTVCAPTEIGEKAGEQVNLLLAALNGAGVVWEPPLWGLYPVELEDRAAIAVGARVPEGMELPGLVREVLPGGPVAETLHTGPYAQLPLAYNALFAAIHERGLRPKAPVREAYLVGPGEAPQEELLTRLIIPVEEDAA